MGKKKGRVSFQRRFQHLRDKMAEDIKRLDIRTLIQEIRKISDFHKIDGWIFVSNKLAKGVQSKRKSLEWKKNIKNKAYLVKQISLLSLLEKYPEQVKIEIDSNSKLIAFRYQAGGVPQTYHSLIPHLREALEIGNFDVKILPESVQEIIEIAQKPS